MLVAANVAPSQSQIMEEIPSQIIILESSYTSKREQPIGPYTPLAHNHQQIHTEPELPISYGKERCGWKDL